MVRSVNDIHVVEFCSQFKTMATASRMRLLLVLVFVMSRLCGDLNVRTKTW